jgi:hypothetical protein
MATAFSYSGTGLESAIQSGSGGIGTGSSITLEVDAVPSDLSQGDTVKVAIGTATNFANGNGETVHGDIGGAGANGGTNITLTDRGQEGTSAASWSEGDPVRVGVSGRNDAGPERSVVQGQILKTPGVYADFQGISATNADGVQIASGQTLRVDQGGWSIQDGYLTNDGTGDPDIITLPFSPSSDFWHVESLFRGSTSSGEMGGIIGHWADINNFSYHTWINNNVGTVQGIAQIRKETGTYDTRRSAPLASTGNGPGAYYSRFRVGTGHRGNNDRLWMTNPLSFGGDYPGTLTTRVGLISREVGCRFYNFIAKER